MGMFDDMHDARTATVERVWSEQQGAIFEWFEDGDGNLVVRARAGTGKTTTILEGVRRAPERNIVVCAFNKRIADELAAKLRASGSIAKAKTLHAIGAGIVRNNRTRLDVLDDKSKRGKWLTNEVCEAKVPDKVRRIITDLHTKGREIVPHARKAGDLQDLIFKFDMEPEQEFKRLGYDADFIEARALAAMELASQVESGHPMGIDFADMIFLPVRNHWANKTEDLVVVDEGQDMTISQLELAEGICRGRFAIVGDDRQAIYGFRGADSGSIDRLKKKLGAVELGLTTTYRCGKVIVDLAKRIVPDFEAGPDNPQGSIRTINIEHLTDHVEPGDFVLSRVNAPLMGVALGSLRAGKKARIAGKDFARSITSLVRRLAQGDAAVDVTTFIKAVQRWERDGVERAMAKEREDQADEIKDKAMTLIALTDGIQSVADLITRIEFLFTDDGLGSAGFITCSSVHKAKGLEANRVFILKDTLKSKEGKEKSREEWNIEYVAITRAKRELVWVVEGAIKEEDGHGKA